MVSGQSVELLIVSLFYTDFSTRFAPIYNLFTRLEAACNNVLQSW